MGVDQWALELGARAWGVCNPCDCFLQYTFYKSFMCSIGFKMTWHFVYTLITVFSLALEILTTCMLSAQDVVHVFCPLDLLKCMCIQGHAFSIPSTHDIIVYVFSFLYYVYIAARSYVQHISWEQERCGGVDHSHQLQSHHHLRAEGLHT